MDMEVMEGAEARRLGSLQTEVGGATRAMSGIRPGTGGNRRGCGGRVRGTDTAGSRMVLRPDVTVSLIHWSFFCFLSQTRVTRVTGRDTETLGSEGRGFPDLVGSHLNKTSHLTFSGPALDLARCQLPGLESEQCQQTFDHKASPL